MGRVNVLQSTPTRFAGKPVVVTYCDEFMGPDIVSGRWCTLRMEVEMIPAPNCYAVIR